MAESDTQEIWLRYQATRDPALREQLILQYAPLVKYVIGRMSINLPNAVGNDDVLSLGTIGLVQAVDRYDPTVGVKFETYAIRRIRGAIIDAIRSLQPLSRDTYRHAREIDHAYDDLLQETGQLPNDHQLAEHLGWTDESLRSARADANVTLISLESTYGESNGDGSESVSLIDQLADESELGLSEIVEARELRGALVRSIEALPERDHLVITLYYYEELTLREIAEVLSVSTSRVSQLHAAAVFKLRGLLRAFLTAQQPVAAGR